mgnify:CR=1 FL=1
MKHDDSVDDEDVPEMQLTPEGKERNEVLSMFFEGTKPLQEMEERQAEGVSLDSLSGNKGDRKPMTEVWRTLAGVKKPAAPSQSSISKDDLEAREEKRLKMLRESLERQVNG